ncbi:ATP-binding protein [Streptomyces sp. NBC_01476]|uniref:AAA family ATPase n=1 Tax=Streptomyces sp. NBC_01476 TaxID=2903881 RepID=UPI002E325E47|nr:ATP-binding protein [Streptomyces sp. NBC_01476]
MTAQRIKEVRLTAFKSFRDEAFPLAPLTVLIGRNSSGKSNALDGLEVLSRLAHGDDIVDALESRSGPAGSVRGGLTGCVPHGSDRFSLGCTVGTERGPVHLDVTVQVTPDVRIVEECLSGPTAEGHRDVLKSSPRNPQSGYARVNLHEDGGTGTGTGTEQATLSRWQLLSSQISAFANVSPDWQSTIWCADTMLSALRNVFHLDPVPHLMRQYVPARDANLRRTAENLSAAVGRIERADPALFQRLVSLLRGLADHDIDTLAVSRSDLGDVMLALDEGDLGLTPAREMSDGMLRFLAVTTALLTGGDGLDLGSSRTEAAERSLMLVIEELENGLHASQAAEVLKLVREASAENSTQALITTHSPALLSALDGADHEGVVVCWRDRATGRSRLTRLTELDGYPAAMAAGSLGDVITHGRLDNRQRRGDRDYTEFNRLLGIE